MKKIAALVVAAAAAKDDTGKEKMLVFFRKCCVFMVFCLLYNDLFLLWLLPLKESGSLAWHLKLEDDLKCSVKVKVENSDLLEEDF